MLRIRYILFLLALFVGVSANGTLVLYIDVVNKEMSFVGKGPFADLDADSVFPNLIRLRTPGSSTGLFYSRDLPDGFAQVGAADSVNNNGLTQSTIKVRSNGRVLDITLAFPGSGAAEGFLTGGGTIYYGSSYGFDSAIGDGSGLTSRTLTASYMYDPSATFPYDSAFEIPIVTELVVIPEPPTIYAMLSGIALLVLVAARSRCA